MSLAVTTSTCATSVTALDNLFRQRRLYANDVKRVIRHGGSLRLFNVAAEPVQPALTGLLADEAARTV